MRMPKNHYLSFDDKENAASEEMKAIEGRKRGEDRVTEIGSIEDDDYHESRQHQ